MTPALRRAFDLHVPQDVNVEGSRFDAGAEEARQVALTALNRTRASLLDDEWPKKVFAFHKLYGVPTGEPETVQQIDAYRRILRRRLLEEEVKETLDADSSGDIIETIDGLLDTIYVAIGWLIELGLSPALINRCMEEVHASNLTKVDDNGQPIFDDGGKVLKGNNYVQVDLTAILGDAFAERLLG